MDVVIIDKVKTIPVTSVVLGMDKDDPGCQRLHMFFCPNCQNPIFQFKGRVVSIMPGEAPLLLPVYLKCRCGKVYQVNDVI